ncbi:MAG: hypothetical protein AB4041_17475 [Microcystaceae cyanobacterium]
MPLSITKGQTKNRELDILQDQYVEYFANYLTKLYKAGDISQKSYDKLIRVVYAQKVEQMIERQIEAQLEKITVRINQDTLEDAMASLLKKLSK